jgi:agmatinase
LSSEKHLYTDERVPAFLGIKNTKSSVDAYLIGVPFDSAVSWRPGTRFGPQAIRDASFNIETYSYRYSFDAEDLRIEDLGDLSVVHGDSEKTLKRLEETVAETLSQGTPFVTLGGEHTVAYAPVKALKPDLFIVFDAHTDMRDQYLDYRWSHATISRRVSELVHPKNVVQVGVRASCREELEFVRKSGITEISCLQINRDGVESAAKVLEQRVRSSAKVYVSIDLDVLDPAFMPGVGNPEAEGLTTSQLLGLLDKIIDQRLVGLDVTELNPLLDTSGVSAVTAARIILEILSKKAAL